MFANNKLMLVTIPNSVTRIDNTAFLYNQTIPEDLTIIGGDPSNAKEYVRTIDNVGNVSDEVQVTVQIDREAPVILLIGEQPMIVETGDNYEEPGATAEDNMDISHNIIISGEVDTTKLRIYEVRYNVTDRAGNAAIEVVREVHVVAPKVIRLEIQCMQEHL